MLDRMEAIIAEVARMNGISQEEAWREMEAAITLVFGHSPKPPDLENAQRRISPSGEPLEADEFIGACVKMRTVPDDLQIDDPVCDNSE